MNFTEDWFGAPSCKAVQRLVAQTQGLGGRAIEVGCWAGTSTVDIAQGCSPAKVQAVATWEGAPGAISPELAAERDVFATFNENISELTRGNVETYRMGWRDYFAQDAARSGSFTSTRSTPTARCSTTSPKFSRSWSQAA